MGNGNGEMKNLQIRGAGVPILGQPFEVDAGFVTIMGRCKCGGEKTGILLAGGPGQCPSCQRIWVLTKAQFDATTGQLMTAVGLVRTPTTADGPAKEVTP